MKLTDCTSGLTTAESTSRPSFPAWTVIVARSAAFCLRALTRSSSAERRWPAPARIEIGFDDAYGSRRSSTDNVTQNHVALARVGFDTYFCQLVAFRSVDPGELAVREEPRS